MKAVKSPIYQKHLKILVSIAFVVSLFCLAIAVDVSPLVRGPDVWPDGWRYEYSYTNTISKSPVPIAVFVLICAFFAHFDHREKDIEMDKVKNSYAYENLKDAISHYVRFKKNATKVTSTPIDANGQPTPASAPSPAPTPVPPVGQTSGAVPEEDGDFIKNYNIGHSNIIGQMQSSKKLDMYMGPVDDDAYFLRELSQLGNAGDDLLQMAKNKFGEEVADYAPAVLRILESGVSLGVVDVMTKKIALAGRLARAIEDHIS